MISIHNSIKAFMRSKQPAHVTVESNTGKGNHIRIFITYLNSFKLYKNETHRAELSSH